MSIENVPELPDLDPLALLASIPDGDDEGWGDDIEATALAVEQSGHPVWIDIEDRWGAQALNPLPRSASHWAELWQALPEAGGETTVVIATAVETEYGPEAVMVEQRVFDNPDYAKVWAEEWQPVA